MRQRIHRRSRSDFRTRRGWLGAPQSGQAIVLVIFFLLFAVLMLGVVVEVGHLFIVKRQLQNDADAGATWGAMQLDIDALRISNGNRVDVLSPGDSNTEVADRAGQNIIDFMSSKGFSLDEWNWEWHGCTMQINISRKVQTIFVSSLGITEATINVAAKARLNNTDNKTGC